MVAIRLASLNSSESQVDSQKERKEQIKQKSTIKNSVDQRKPEQKRPNTR